MLIVGVIVVVIGGVMFLLQKPGSDTKQKIEPTPAGIIIEKKEKEGEVAEGEAAVTIQNFAFDPVALKVKKGTNVTWTNKDSVQHDVASDTGTELKSELLGQGESYSHVFNTVGTFAYHCNPHVANMKATVEVVE